MSETKQLDCHSCDYEWDYGGDLGRATCPSCGGKVKVESDTETEEESEDTEVPEESEVQA